MKMRVTRVLAHGEGDPTVKVGGVEMASDHGTLEQKIHGHEVLMECIDEGYQGHLHMMITSTGKDAPDIFVVGKTLEVSFK